MMPKQLTYNNTPLKSREENSNLIKGSVYSAKVKIPKSFDSAKVLKSTDLGNGYHIFTEQGKKK
ncbi:hypothetical protein CHX27_06145 [Flavobacterium aurantiibacter]|uniref:Uncharacterized protein n=1 Tax=Flavobacterium aurantiibacter TaxID=2023067 RepID=A0A255ZVP9_9FLAO|nr:hypothetical protein CHX27_06145 [Flavobacterium aurantiibacter]|tara:strand:+ start:176 stop:367 length:192 start_codon:yes stop_codon:yes gene_type:complete